MNATARYSGRPADSRISSAVLTRRVFVRQAVGGTLAGTWLGSRSRAAESAVEPSLQAIRAGTLNHIERMRVDGKPYGRYRYAAGCKQPTLYSSTYAAMTRHLYRDLDSLTESQRAEWVEYLQSHQDDDGLFRDPVIFDQGWYKGDPEWCGRRHLSCHVVTALTCLGSVAKKPLRFLDPLMCPAGPPAGSGERPAGPPAVSLPSGSEPSSERPAGGPADHSPASGLVTWLETRDWERQPDFVGNEVLNVGTLLQYARDFQKDERCRPAVRELLDWMTHHHINEQTGLWGKLDVKNPRELSRAVQGAYHFWPLYFYDREPIPYPQRVIDSCLATQNACGGFGQGVHTGSDRESSACEDIDSIDPLVRLMQATDHRRADVRTALQRGLKQVLLNQTPDGGWWFVRGKGFTYGHEQLAAGATEGAMFPTWFRTLTLAYLAKALPDSVVGQYDWQFCNCPGVQFWEDK